MNFSGKKLLILAGAGVHTKVVKVAKEMGIYTIVTDNLVDSPAKMIADESWMYSITDTEAIINKCKEKKVDGVINFCIDPGQKPYLRICEELGLPCYTSKEQLNILTNKRKFKDYCIEHNIDVIPEYTEEDISNDKVEYPVFIKPIDSRGSRGQSICYSKDEAIKGIEIAKKESSNGEYLCEKFMNNYQDIGSAFYVIDGEPYLIKFGDRHLGNHEDNLDKQVICTRLPSIFSPIFVEKVQDRVKKMIKSLGIKFGPVFLQGFIDGDTVRYYDPAQRMPGGDYDLILKEATGFDTVKTMIHFALTGDTTIHYGKPDNAFYLDNKIALLVTISVRAGKMQTVIGLDKMLMHPNVIYGRQIIPEGTIISDTGDIGQRVAAIGALISDKNDIASFMECLYNTYKILDENGDDMIISKWKYKE